MLPMNFCDDWRFLSLNLGEVLGAAPWEQIPGRSSLKVNFSEEPVWFESLSLFPSWFKNWVSWVPLAFNDVSTFVKKKKSGFWVSFHWLLLSQDSSQIKLSSLGLTSHIYGISKLGHFLVFLQPATNTVQVIFYHIFCDVFSFLRQWN